MIHRREFITLLGGAAAAWPLVARAQQAAMPVIGFLSARSREESAHLVAAFRRGLAEQGAIEGQNAAIEYRWADGRYDLLPEQAAEFVRRPVAVLVALGGDMTARAAISATRTIPIVAVFIGDPVASGLVVSLNRPEGNVTGISNLNAVIESKRLGLLRELVPQARTMAALQNPWSPTAASQQKEIEEAAHTIGLRVLFWQASNEQELETAFEAMAQNRILAGLVPLASCSFGKNRRRHRFAPNAGMRCGLHANSRKCGRCLGWSSTYVDGADTSEPPNASPIPHHRSGFNRRAAHDIPCSVTALANANDQTWTTGQRRG